MHLERFKTENKQARSCIATLPLCMQPSGQRTKKLLPGGPSKDAFPSTDVVQVISRGTWGGFHASSLVEPEMFSY